MADGADADAPRSLPFIGAEEGESHEAVLERLSRGFAVFGYGSLVWKKEPLFDDPVNGYVKGWVRRFWQQSPDHRGTPERPGRVVTLLPASHPLVLRHGADGFGGFDDDARGSGGGGGASEVGRASAAAAGAGGAGASSSGTVPAATAAAGGSEGTGTGTGTATGGVAADATVVGVVWHVAAEHAAEVLRDLDVREKAGYSRGFVDVHCADGATRRALVFLATDDNADFAGPMQLGALARHIAASEGPSGRNADYVTSLADAVAAMGSDEPRDTHLARLAAAVRAELELERVAATGTGTGTGTAGE